MLLCTQAFGNAFSPIMNFRFLNMCFDSKDFSQYKTSRLIGVNIEPVMGGDIYFHLGWWGCSRVSDFFVHLEK